MKEKERNLRPSDDGISTKKGFLITLPGKKKNQAEKQVSSIIMDSASQTPALPNKDNNGNKNKQNNNDKRPNLQNDGTITQQARQAKKEMKKNKYDSKKRKSLQNDGADNKQDNSNNSKNRPNNQKESFVKGVSVQNGDNSKKHGNFASDKQKQNAEHNTKPLADKNSLGNGSNSAKHQNGNRRKKGFNHNNQNHNDKSSRPFENGKNSENIRNIGQNADKTPKNNDKKKNTHKGANNSPEAVLLRQAAERNNTNKPKGTETINSEASFSSRKATASIYSHATSADQVKLTGNYIPDINAEKKSLEEKYANAIPLAKQIELDEQKRKGILTQAQIEAKNQYKYQDIEALRNEKPENQIEIVGVRFREAGKIYYFDPDGNDLPFGTPVIVETARGNEYGTILIENRFVPTANIVPPLKKIQRVATADDTARHNANKEQEKEAEKIFNEKIAFHKLEMNLIHVEYTFDNSKLLFYFSAEGRVDFRELVKDLATVFRTRIELRQIGVRDEAKMIGGFGVCGRPVCCSTFLGDFAQVSIKMAKDQSISLNSSKISGTCGRLMCCLRYENEVYESEGAKTPKLGAIVNTPDGKGTVVERNALKGTIKVTLEADPSTHPKVFMRDEVTVLGYNKSHDDDEELKALEKLD